MTTAWSQSTVSLIKDLGTSQSSGLTEKQVMVRQTRLGKNVLKTQKTSSQLALIARQFNNPMTYTLMVATVIAFSMGELLDAMAILAIVIMNAGISYAQESKAEAAIQSLKKLTVPKARVLREGGIRTIDSVDVLPGDILQLEAGDYVVADARVIEAYQLAADESVLTGESMPVEKNSELMNEDTELADRRNMLYAATAISAGSGRAVVTAIGMDTEIGRIAGLLENKSPSATPLQQRLDKVSNKLLMMGGAVILAVAILGIVHGHDWFTIFMSAISLAVAAIPEGLPAVVTLSLALAVRRMTKRHALVRNMSAVETLGSTDIICTDKTGTLTTGKMSVREMFSLDEGIIDGNSFQGNDLIFQALVLCNNASIEHGASGDTTEVALLKFAEKLGVDIAKLREKNLRVHEWSFESNRKRMSVAIVSGDEVTIFCKGAPDSLLPLCQLSLEQRAQVDKALLELSQKGHRILALAQKQEARKEFSKRGHSEIEKDFNFLGLVAMADPPKLETIPAVKECKDAGIKVVMITGDHPITANAVARELGIPDAGFFDQVMTGKELSLLSQEELRIRVEKTAVYARVTPEFKLKIVEALQDNGHVVAMTGDGVNDAPALKKASIGIAMGKGGTEVARQASAMVLTNDDFSTIVAAVEEGRAIFGNIKRTIQYLLSTNLAEILIMLGAVLIGLPVPVAPLGLLWINLVTDGFPSLALAAEPVAKDYLKSSQRPSPNSFFDKAFMRELFYVGILMTVIEISVYHYVLITQDPLSAKSYAFTLLVYLCLLRSFSCRSEVKTFFELPFNPWHLSSVVIPIVLQLVIQHSQTFERLFQVRSLSLSENGLLFLFSLIPVTLVEMLKIWRRV